MDPAGTRAQVSAARTNRTAPGYIRVLRPGRQLRGIAYGTWQEHLGRTVEIREPPPHSGESLPRLVPLPRDFEGVVEEIRKNAQAEQQTSGEAAAPYDPGDDWRPDPELCGNPPRGPEYGCWAAGVFIACSREELAEWCAGFPAILRVWTPETRGFARPEEVPFLVHAYRTRALRTARRTVLWSSLVLAASLPLVALDPELRRSALVLFPAFSAVKLLTGAYKLREAWNAGPDVFAQHRAEFRHMLWIEHRSRGETLWILGCLAAVMVLRMLTGTVAIESAGLVKPAVREGEAWRLLTGPLLHANLVHIWMNATALLALGPLIEAHARRGALPLVFLVSALGGSVLSLLVLPDVTSVGASGGIMGMAGFLGVFALRDPARVPPGFGRRMALGVAATAVLGLVGIQLIDNAAHLGGLLAGALLGYLLTRPGLPEACTRHAGRIALAVTFAGGALAVGLMLAAW